jgi:hypothetical protein
MIYEGANGIQALDLVGRKLAAERRPRGDDLLRRDRRLRRGTTATRALKPFIEGLAEAKAKLQEATMWLMQNGLPTPTTPAPPRPTTCTSSASRAWPTCGP